MLFKDSRQADEVLCSDNPGMQWVGFCIVYPGGTVTHSVGLDKVKEWDPWCPEVKSLFLEREGRRSLAASFMKGGLLHEDCSTCLAHHVMTT